MQPDGTILVGAFFAAVPAFALGDGMVARFLSTGEVDPTFGSEGLVRVTPRDANVSARVVRQADGKLVVAADRLARLEPDGALDCGFVGGVVTIPQVTATAVALAADGTILVGGFSRGPVQGAALARAESRAS